MRQTCFEIKNCVCGGKPQIEHKGYVFFVVCKECGCSGAAYPLETSAINSWNKKNKLVKEGKK